MVFRLERQRRLAPSIYAEEAYGLALTMGSDRRWSLYTDSRDLWQISIVASPILNGGFEASSPYGYPGIYADRSLSAEQVTEHWDRTVQLLRADGVISLFLRFPPFEYPGLGIETFFGLNQLELELVSKTIEVATSEPDELWPRMSGRARTAVRKALKLGMTAEVFPASQTNLGPDSPFRTLYESTMTRIGASSHHVYGDSYYSTLLAALSDRAFVVNVSTFEGKPAASAMILLDDEVVHYHLSGSDPQAAKSGANNLLLWTILEWSARQNFQSVHLGGGLSADDSLFRFKQSFGGAARDFWVGRAVIDQDRYAQLVVRHAESLGMTVAQLESSGYFPSFRAEP